MKSFFNSLLRLTVIVSIVLFLCCGCGEKRQVGQEDNYCVPLTDVYSTFIDTYPRYNMDSLGKFFIKKGYSFSLDSIPPHNEYVYFYHKQSNTYRIIPSRTEIDLFVSTPEMAEQVVAELPFAYTFRHNPKDAQYYPGHLGTYSDGNLNFDVYADTAWICFSYYERHYSEKNYARASFTEMEPLSKSMKNQYAFTQKYRYNPEYMKFVGRFCRITGDDYDDELFVDLSDDEYHIVSFLCTMNDSDALYRLRDLEVGRGVVLYGFVRGMEIGSVVVQNAKISPLCPSEENVAQFKKRYAEVMAASKQNEKSEYKIDNHPLASDFYGHWKTDKSDAYTTELLITAKYIQRIDNWSEPHYSKVERAPKERWELKGNTLQRVDDEYLYEQFQIDPTHTYLYDVNDNGKPTVYYKVKK